MRVYERLAEEFARQDISRIFGLIGQDTMRLAAVLERSGLSYINARHEVGAVSMAAGFARLSGTVGVALASRGPGLTNALSGIVAADRAGASIVVLAGDEPAKTESAYRDPKYLDQSSVLAASGVRVIRPTSAEETIPRFREALAQATLGVTVAMLVPVDVLEATVDERAEHTIALPRRRRVAPNSSDVAAGADLVEAHIDEGRTLLLAGRGAVSAGALGELTRLGALTNSLMGTTLMAKSLFDQTPNSIGIVGSLSAPRVKDVLVDTKVVVAVGTSLDPFTTDYGNLFPRAQWIHIDSNADAFGRYLRPQAPILADARSATGALHAELTRRRPRLEGQRAALSVASSGRMRSGGQQGVRRVGDHFGDALDPDELMMALDRILPADRTVVVDAGHQLTFACTHLSVLSPSSFVFPIEFRCIGLSLSTAIGAAMARPDRLTVVSLGDGAMMMSLGELDTAVHHHLPLLVVVMNDAAFGAEMHYLEMLGLPTETARLVNPSFAQVAISMGADATTITRLDDVDQIRRRLSSPLRRPLLLDCRISDRVHSNWLNLTLRRDHSEARAGGED